MKSLTLAYVTARKDPKIEWLFDSLAKQIENQDVPLIVVDRHCDAARKVEFRNLHTKALLRFSGLDGIKLQLFHVQPKPNVWNGPHRLTKEDWFAAASHRNTAICLCETSHIAFVDDLSVLMPGWLDAAYEAVEGDYVACGAYKKLKQLVVEGGVPVSYEETEAGTDNRLSLVSKDVSECDGGWLYGCSVVGPVEAFLSVDGWPEMLCDSMGFEDCCMGIVLRNAGWHLKYDRRLLTLESDELHFVEPAMRKEDWHFEDGVPVKGGNGSSDKSHAALAIARQSKTFENAFGEGGIRALRDHVLAGNPFPIKQIPEHEWFTGQLISEL